MDGIGVASCLMEGFSTSGVEPSGSATRQLISKMYTGELSIQYGGGWNWLRIVTVAGFDISSVEPSGFLLAESLLFIKLDLTEIRFENSRCMELTQDRVQFLAFIFPVLTVRILPPSIYVAFHKYDLRPRYKYGSYRQFPGLPGRGIDPSRVLYTQRTTQIQELPTCIHGASGNRTKMHVYFRTDTTISIVSRYKA